MATGRRHNKPVPHFTAMHLRVGQKLVEGWLAFTATLEDYLRRTVDTDSGLPAKHAFSHVPQTGSDPLLTDIPANPTGQTAKQGTADTLMRSDATIKQGIVTIKGDLLGFDSLPNRIPVGAAGQVLIADPIQTLGVRWGSAAAPGAESERIDEFLLSQETVGQYALRLWTYQNFR
jgi:hypothetical protein